MIRMVQNNSAANAKEYFSEALVKSDYYVDNKQELQGRFCGQLGWRLGIWGPASKETFFALCENKHPKTGETLTQRMRKDRITGYDINFHCPKSISVVSGLYKDSELLEAFQRSVHNTMLDIQADVKTRVRKNNRYEDRTTGELAWGEFIHQTARPVDGQVPDPHLHAHCFVFNATWDDGEKIYKAAKFRDIKRSMPYYQARFHKRLLEEVVDAGYTVRLTDKSFEIVGVPKRVIDHFSKRTEEIGKTAKEKNITDAKALDGLGARTRSKKQKGLSMEELKIEWLRQITALGIDEKEQQAPIRGKKKEPKKETTAKHSIDYALKDSFERASVVTERQILTTAYKHALAYPGVSVDDIAIELLNRTDRNEVFRVVDAGRIVCTTKEVLDEEKRMVALAQKGFGSVKPLYSKAPLLTNLKPKQAAAIEHVLTTKNRVSIIRGAAGSGKTTLLRDAVQYIQQANKQVTIVAPTAHASHTVLRGDGFDEAETVARLLVDVNMQAALKNQALIVDEAGLLGTKDMGKLLEIVTKQNARLILVGDTRQHSSVVRGDALRILNTVAGIRPAEVNQIQRQKNKDYRSAIEDFSKGQMRSGFRKLDAMGCIKEVDPEETELALVKDYLRTISKGKSALIISPTHAQGNIITERIRTELKHAGILGKKEISVTKLVNASLTEAQRGHKQNYQPGQVIQFNQNLKNIKRGSVWSVTAINEDGVEISNDKGVVTNVPLDKSALFEVYKKHEMPLAKGDKIQITKNGFDLDKKRLNNGTILEVGSVTKKGEITVINKTSNSSFTINKDFGHISHAHCITSYSAQGKTVDEVFVYQPVETFGATDAKQFYVSASRGRDMVHVYTDSKEALLENVVRLRERESAMELVNKANIEEHRRHLELLLAREIEAANDQTRQSPSLNPVKEHGHEPRF